MKNLELSDLDAERLLAILNEYANDQKEELDTIAEYEEDDDTPITEPAYLAALYQRDIADAERFAKQLDDLFGR